jgi:hypothetical protein
MRRFSGVRGVREALARRLLGIYAAETTRHAADAIGILMPSRLFARASHSIRQKYAIMHEKTKISPNLPLGAAKKPPRRREKALRARFGRAPAKGRFGFRLSGV